MTPTTGSTSDPTVALLAEDAVELARELIRVDTSNPPGNETAAARVVRDWLEARGVASEIIEGAPGRGTLIASIEGSGDGPSFAMCGHLDVVPAPDPLRWTHPPFSGQVDGDGWLWGRGALDMKGQVASRVAAFANAARSGTMPPGTLRLICQADEERGDSGAGMEWLVRARPDLRVDLAIDEGGGERIPLTDGRVIVPISVGEKACMPVRVHVHGESGHASVPTLGRNAVVLLSEVIQRITRHVPVLRMTPTTSHMLDVLDGGGLAEAGPGSSDGLRARIARAGALSPVLTHELPALCAATMAPTIVAAGTVLNVMPDRATVDLDCRIVPGQTLDELLDEIRAAIGPDIEFELEPMTAEPEGGSTSPIDNPVVAACARFLADDDPGATLLPALGAGFTDAHHLRAGWGTAAYGFCPVRATPLDVYQQGFHNVDERIHTDDIRLAVRFHHHLITGVQESR